MSLPTVTAVEATTTAVSGDGRAVAARLLPDGDQLALATTTGVLLVPAGEPPIPLETFVRPTRVATMAVAPDGQRLAVGATNPNRITIHDLTNGANGAATATYLLDQEPRTVAFVDRGEQVPSVIAHTPAAVLLEPPDGATELVALTTAGGPVGAPAIMTDGTVITPLPGTQQLEVSGSGDDGDATTRMIEGIGTATVVDAVSSPDGQLLAVSLQEGDDPFELEHSVVIVDPTSMDVLATVPAGEDLTADRWAVTDGALIVTEDAQVTVNDLTGRKLASVDPRSDSPVVSIRTGPSVAVLTHADGTTVALTPDTGESWSQRVLTEGGTSHPDVSVTADGASGAGSSAVAVDFHGRVTAWDLTDGSVRIDDRQHETGRLTAVAIADGGATMATASDSGRVLVLDDALQVTSSFDDGHGRIDSVAIDPGSQRIVTGAAERLGDIAFDDTVTVRNRSTESIDYELGGEGEDVPGCSSFANRLRFTSDGALMTVVSHDFTVDLVEVATGESTATLVHPTTVFDVAFTPDDQRLVAATDDSTVRVWNVADQEVDTEYQAPQGGYLAIAMLPDGATMAASDITGAIRIVDVDDGETRVELEGASFRSNVLAASPAGGMVAAPAGEGRIAVWSTTTGRLLALLEGHTGDVTGLSFSGDGRRLASASEDGTTRVWTIASSESA